LFHSYSKCISTREEIIEQVLTETSAHGDNTAPDSHRDADSPAPSQQHCTPILRQVYISKFV